MRWSMALLDPNRLKRGDVIEDKKGHKFVVVKIGRGLVRSAILFGEHSHTWVLVTEIDYWYRHRRYRFVSRKSANLKFAKQYCAHHPHLPDV
jgi:hypothetical protein